MARATMQLSADAARLVLVAAQGLDKRPRRRARKADVLEAIRRMGVLQIDTIHVVARSPYLVLWSRLGDYDPVWLEELLGEGRLFEYWAHEASFLPIEDFALFRHRMIDPGSMGWKYSHEWLERHGDVVEHVLQTLRERGPVRSADFERSDGKRGGGWWSWKPEKRALELLFTAGRVMVARRERFQRVYDLRERVLPGWDDVQLPPVEATDRALVDKAARALGVATTRWLADYFRMSLKATERAVQGLVADGVLQQVAVTGWKTPAFIHAANTELADQARTGSMRPTLTTVLSPFDPLCWDRARGRALFGFDYALECYTPAPRRRWGYFVLPVLRRGRLVARLDAKAHRAAGRFEVISFFLEEGVRPSAALYADISDAIVRLAAWHGTPEVVVKKTVPRGLLMELRQALRAAAP